MDFRTIWKRHSPNNPLKLPPFPLGHPRRLLRHLLPGDHAAHAIECFAGHRGTAQAVVLERTVSRGDPVGDDFANRVGVNSYFILCVFICPQAQEVEEVVQVHFPVPLRVDVGGEIHAGEFAGKAVLGAVRAIGGDHGLVVVIGAVAVGFQDFENAGGLGPFQHAAPALIVDDRLSINVGGFRDVEFTVEDRIAGGVFVDAGGAVVMFCKSLNDTYFYGANCRLGEYHLNDVN
jgi:hypothetical protein